MPIHKKLLNFIPIVGPILSAIIGSSGARSGARARVAGGQQGIEEQRNTLAQIMEMFGPGREAGLGALNTFASAFIPGFEGVGGLDPINSGDLSEIFRNLPGTQFGLDQIVKNVGNSFASRGGAFGGNALRALTDRQANFANDRVFCGLRDLIGVGERATVGSAGATSSAGSNIANLFSGQGEARASGFEGAAGSINNAIQGGLNNFLLQQIFSRNRGNPTPPPPSSPGPRFPF